MTALPDTARQEEYRQNGVVCLRGVLGSEWIALTRRGIERNLAQPGRFFRDHTAEGSGGRYMFDFWTWPDIPEFRALVFDSPVAPLVARLLDARSVYLLMDNWFLREAGASTGAPWHHDEPYFDFSGTMCSVWIPLEEVNARSGLVFLPGSHRDGVLRFAEPFSAAVDFDARAEGYEPMPEIDLEHDPRLVSWDLAPGDCLVFDLRTLHGALPGIQPGTSYRMSLRFGAEDTRFRPRGEWTREISDYLIGLGQQSDCPPGCSLLPRVWPSQGPG